MVFERKYSDEVREDSVRRVFERRREEPANRSILREVAEEFGIGPQSLRQWVQRYDDGSYDYESPSVRRIPADAPGTEQPTRYTNRQLIEKVADLERQIAVLEEDNRSLSRVVAIFGDQLRLGASTDRVQVPSA